VLAEAGDVWASGLVTSAKDSAATPPLPQRRVDGLDKLLLLGAGRTDVALWA
jgi:hypothetical protein